MNVKNGRYLLLFFVINGMYACKGNKNISAEYAQKSYSFKSLTGKDIYKGIVFGYAEEIPEIKNSYQNNLNSLDSEKKTRNY